MSMTPLVGEEGGTNRSQNRPAKSYRPTVKFSLVAITVGDDVNPGHIRSRSASGGVTEVASAGVKPEPHYTEFPGVGHSSWGPAYEKPDLWDWLFEQRRSKP